MFLLKAYVFPAKETYSAFDPYSVFRFSTVFGEIWQRGASYVDRRDGDCAIIIIAASSTKYREITRKERATLYGYNIVVPNWSLKCIHKRSILNMLPRKHLHQNNLIQPFMLALRNAFYRW